MYDLSKDALFSDPYFSVLAQNLPKSLDSELIEQNVDQSKARTLAYFRM